MNMRMATIAAVLVALGTVHGQEPLNLVHPLPQHGPPWLEGYQVRWPVRVCSEPSKLPARTILVSIPTGGWLKPDASDLEVCNAEGKLQKSLVLSTDPTGHTIVQFERNGNDGWYWIYGANPKAPAKPAVAMPDPVFREGLTLEVRDWAGDDLSSWAKVRAGLDKSTKVIANAIVGEAIQNCSPARPNQPKNSATSFRGFLDIKKAGTYRFFVNADDASFLFIDGFKVFERPGSNGRVGTIKLKDLEKMFGSVELKEGIHSFELHQAIGDKSNADGVCALLWSPPGEAKFTYVLAKDLKHPIYARAAGMQRAGKQPLAGFEFGIDDTLDANGVKLHIVRFEAFGDFDDKDRLVWDFGDGTMGTGRSVRHVYFREADFAVTLQCGEGLPPFRRTVHAWSEPGETSPLSLDLAVRLLEETPWQKLPIDHVREIFAFLVQCGQPRRWKLLEEVTRFLLEQKNDTLDFRNQLYVARVETLAHLGRSVEGIKLAEKVLADFVKSPLLQVRLQLAMADIFQDQLKDLKGASKIYKNIIEEHGRTDHPFLRRAGIRWGDLFVEAGDLARAAETYRLAATLGGEKFQTSAQSDASSRGALLRIAEQKLKSGDALQTRQLLEQIDLNYPGQRIDGFYCFLRGEADRQAGRYESALRHYEILIKLPQWAGYRDRALLGIARCQFQEGELPKARRELDLIKDNYPKLYESEKLTEFERILEARLERVRTAKEEGRPRSAFFDRFETGYEPEEQESFGTSGGLHVVAAPGMKGSHVAMLPVYPEPSTMVTYQRTGLKNLTPGGTYWIEIWYKDVIRPAVTWGTATQAFLHVYLTPENSKVPEVVTSAYLHKNTYQWHKLGFKLKVPMAQDYMLKLYFYNQSGVILYDAVTVQAMSDRQIDALQTFYEGARNP